MGRLGLLRQGADEASALEYLDDTTIVCRSYASMPGYTHSDDLLLAFAPALALNLALALPKRARPRACSPQRPALPVKVGHAVTGVGD